jgi:hypothetical protein
VQRHQPWGIDTKEIMGVAPSRVVAGYYITIFFFVSVELQYQHAFAGYSLFEVHVVMIVPSKQLDRHDRSPRDPHGDVRDSISRKFPGTRHRTCFEKTTTPK